MLEGSCVADSKSRENFVYSRHVCWYSDILLSTSCAVKGTTNGAQMQ